MKRWIWWCDKCESWGFKDRVDGETEFRLAVRIVETHDTLFPNCGANRIEGFSLNASLRAGAERAARILKVITNYTLAFTHKHETAAY